MAVAARTAAHRSILESVMRMKVTIELSVKKAAREREEARTRDYNAAQRVRIESHRASWFD